MGPQMVLTLELIGAVEEYRTVSSYSHFDGLNKLLLGQLADLSSQQDRAETTVVPK